MESTLQCNVRTCILSIIPIATGASSRAAHRPANPRAPPAPPFGRGHRGERRALGRGHRVERRDRGRCIVEGARRGAGGASRAAYQSHTSNASRASVVIASRGVRACVADEGRGLVSVSSIASPTRTLAVAATADHRGSGPRKRRSALDPLTCGSFGHPNLAMTFCDIGRTREKDFAGITG